MRFRMPARHALLIPSALLIAGGLAACDPAAASSDTEYVVEDAAAEQANSDQASISPDLPNACELLDAADIESAVGQPFEDGDFNAILSDEVLAVCDWYASGESYSTVQVQVAKLDGDFADVRAEADANYGDTSDVTVDGADEAFVAQDGTVVGFAADGYAVTVLHYADEWTDLTDVTTSLANAAASAL